MICRNKSQIKKNKVFTIQQNQTSISGFLHILRQKLLKNKKSCKKTFMRQINTLLMQYEGNNKIKKWQYFSSHLNEHKFIQ